MAAVAPPWPGAVRPSVGARAAAAAPGAEAAAAVAGRARRPGPGAGRALYRGRRLRQEAGGGEGGATQLPGEGGGSAPGGHGAQPAAALTSACAPPASRLGLGLRSAFADRRHPPQLPFSAGTPPPQTWGKVSQLQTGREGRTSPSPLGSQLFLSPPILAAGRPQGLSRALSYPARPLARPPLFPAWPAGPRGPLPAASARPGFPPRGGGSSLPAPHPPRCQAPSCARAAPLPAPPASSPSLPLASPAHVRAEPARAADPAVNPEQSSDPVVLSPPGATLGAPNASRVGTPAPEDAPKAVSARGPGCLGPLSLPVPSPRTHLGGMSEAPGPAAGGSRGDVAALRCPPPAGPPVGLSCWSVLPTSWSRLSPAALSAHSYLERPGPAGSAAVMEPPRGRAELCATQPRPPSRAPGLEARRCGVGSCREAYSQIHPPRCARLATQAPDL